MVAVRYTPKFDDIFQSYVTGTGAILRPEPLPELILTSHLWGSLVHQKVKWVPKLLFGVMSLNIILKTTASRDQWVRYMKEQLQLSVTHGSETTGSFPKFLLQIVQGTQESETAFSFLRHRVTTTGNLHYMHSFGVDWLISTDFNVKPILNWVWSVVTKALNFHFAAH